MRVMTPRTGLLKLRTTLPTCSSNEVIAVGETLMVYSGILSRSSFTPSPPVGGSSTASRRVLPHALPFLFAALLNWLAQHPAQLAHCLSGELSLGTRDVGSSPMAKQSGGTMLSSSYMPG